jgi:hypothetical protein
MPNVHCQILNGETKVIKEGIITVNATVTNGVIVINNENIARAIYVSLLDNIDNINEININDFTDSNTFTITKIVNVLEDNCKDKNARNVVNDCSYGSEEDYKIVSENVYTLAVSTNRALSRSKTWGPRMEGGKLAAKYTKTTEKATIKNNQTRLVHLGPKGGKYVKLDGEFVPLKKAQK